ncbi:unnamed protein product [Brassica rapa subsp. narinosa]
MANGGGNGVGGNNNNSGGGNGGGGNNNSGGGNGGGGNNNNRGGGNGGGGNSNNSGGGNRTVELQPHPVKEQLPGIQYCVNSPPPWFEALVLGFQHYLLSLGITVLIPSLLVPHMGGGDAEKARVIQTMLFVSGLTTLFQSFFGTRLPVIAAPSYAYIIPITSIISSTRFAYYTDPFERFVETLRSIQGALIIAGCFQVLVCFLGLWRNIARFLSPLSIAPLTTFAGLGLYQIGFPLLARCVEVGLPGLILLVLVTQYLPRFLKMKKGVIWDGSRCDRYGMMMCIPLVWLLALLLTSSGVYNHKSQTTQISCRTDRNGLITNTPWIYLPYPFQWGSPTFHFTDSFAMMAASFVTLFESTGLFYASARYGSATPIPPSVISRGTGWLGVGVLLNGMLGGVSGITTSTENVGLLAMTKIGSRRVIQISAAFMIFFSIFGKFGAFFASIPLPIMASVYCIVLCFVCSAGISFLQFCNLNSFNTKFILGFSFFMAITIPQYFREYYNGGWRSDHHSSWFEDVIRVIFMSHTTVAGMIAIVLDCTLSRESDEAKKDCGLKWLGKPVESFFNYKTMNRGSSRQPKANKETISTAKTRQGNVRVTRSRAKALGTSISPSKPVFKQQPKLKKRMASDDTRVCQHKRRAVLKDVTNTLACLDGNNVKASKRERDVDAEKSKLAEDLSKIRMVESATNSKDGDQKENGYDVTGYLKPVDIDSSDQDPKFCSLYAVNMYDSFHVAELDQRPSTSYMVQVQRDIGPSMRGILIDWLVEVSEEYKLASDTLYLAVNLIDRFLSNNYIEKRRLQLLGVTCMLIASKYEEICAPRLEEFCFITDNTYTRLEVVAMETQVLNFLHFRLSVPTTKTFLRRFIQAAQASDQVPHIEMESMKSLANYLAELTLVEYSFLRFLPSLIAASAVFLARWTLDQSKHPWNSTLQHYTRYETPSLKNTVLAMEDLQHNTSGSTLVAIRNKYNQEKFKRVATLTSPVSVTTLFSG